MNIEIDHKVWGFKSGFLKLVALAATAVVLMQVSACSNFSFGPNINTRTVGVGQANGPSQPAAAGETLGNGPVRVALLLPLTGDLASVGISMANGAKLAMQSIASNPSASDNITLIIKDTAGEPAIAAQRASEAVAEGASLVLGPLRAESVMSAGAVTRGAGIPLIGFSNNSGAATQNVYLLNVLPEMEVRRSLGYAKSQGRSSFAAIVSTNAFGRIQEGAFRQAVADLGLNARAIYSYKDQVEAQNAVEQLVPLLQSGAVDTIFLPDRAFAPDFALWLESVGIERSSITILGSADWDGDARISQTAYLAGALYPAIDDAGQLALAPQYQAQFGTTPHAMTTIAFTATLLANSSTLSLATPRYDRALLTRESGFTGRDGLFRFLPDGRSEFALNMKQVVIGGSQKVDTSKLR